MWNRSKPSGRLKWNTAQIPNSMWINSWNNGTGQYDPPYNGRTTNHNQTNLTAFIAEILGTFFLILLGNGVVANVVLQQTKGNNGGWIVITTAWALAVFTGVVVAAPYSGAHLNPAVSI